MNLPVELIELLKQSVV